MQNEDIPLFVAADAGNVALCRELLTQSPELQLAMRRKSNKDTVLHMAVRRRDLELCRLFVEHKVKIDVQNVSMLLASFFSHIKIFWTHLIIFFWYR